MSEYQYYEFLAVDRVLTQHDMRELRKYSTRQARASRPEVQRKMMLALDQTLSPSDIADRPPAHDYRYA
jgi:hypothetical protein